MQFTVQSRGRPIGVTDLGFRRVPGLDRSRSGWFHPNAEGERLMPLVSAVHVAVRACGRRDRTGDGAGESAREQLLASVEYADLREALHHVEALDLTLHREDGSLVPTEDIGIQDTEQLLHLAAEAEAERDMFGQELFEQEQFDQELFDHDMLDEELADYPHIARELEASEDALTPADDEPPPPPYPRYLIHVQLAEGAELL